MYRELHLWSAELPQEPPWQIVGEARIWTAFGVYANATGELYFLHFPDV
jgi:hypothetical protein